MTHRLTTNYAKNYCNRTLIVKVIVENVVTCFLGGHSVDKSPGPDGMHPRVLQQMANTLDTPLAILFNKSIKDGILPEDWKCANLSSIFKKGSKLDAGNYRPVSLTSVPCKILESLIRDSVVEYMDDNEFISTSQHGFVEEFHQPETDSGL